MRARLDAVVVGARFAGRTAAWRLRGRGRDLLVLEADARPGGRIRSDRLGRLLLGADYLGPWYTETAVQMGATAASGVLAALNTDRPGRSRAAPAITTKPEGVA
jgi:phytoene dehydrogenase-like protein